MIKAIKSYTVRELGANLVLTLPKTWIEETGLKLKDKVAVYSDGAMLIIDASAAISQHGEPLQTTSQTGE